MFMQTALDYCLGFTFSVKMEQLQKIASQQTFCPFKTDAQSKQELFSVLINFVYTVPIFIK